MMSNLTMQKVLYVVVALAAVAAGYYLSTHISSPGTVNMPAVAATTHSSNLIGSYRPDFKLAGQSGEFVTPDDFPDKTVLINFWATWCAPCLEEMPMLVELQAQYADAGLLVLGIALDDIEKVQEFVQEFDISYPILVGMTDVMEANRDYGNLSGALPYTVLLDTDGIIQWQYSGALQHDELVAVLQQHLGLQAE